MNVPRTLDNSCDLAVQPTVSTLHIPASNTFIPFQQFSLSDGSTIRNPADDNNNKTTVPVVSVVAAVSGLCPAISVVSMQQPAQLAQAVVTPTIIPTVVTPIAVQTASCLTPTTTMAVANTINISAHFSVPTPQQQTVGNPGFNINPQTSAIINSNIISNSSITSSAHQNSSASTGIRSTTTISTGINNITCSAPNPSNSNTSAKSSSTSAKPNSTNSKTPSSTSGQGASSEQNDDLVKPVFKDGELVLEVECGQNKAILYLSKLCQGSKGPCISFQSSWLTPNEFQFVSGRETAKDWKRSIRHHGKSLKLLLAKGILNVHPTMCDCDGCRQGATLTRKGEKRRIPNGERKPRKPSSNSGSPDGNAIRSAGSSLMASHLGPPGIAQVKPELKRPAGDKSKMADTTTQSSLMEANIGTLKHIPSSKTPQTQRPNSLNTSKDISKQKAVPSSSVSAQSSALGPVTTTPANTSLTVPAQLSSLLAINTSPAINASSAPSTPSLATFPIAAPISPSAGSMTYSATNSAASLSSQESPTSIMTTAAMNLTAAGPELQSGHAPSSLGRTQMLSPNLPDNKRACTPNSSIGCDVFQPPSRTVNKTTISEPDYEMSDEEDINVCNDSNEYLNSDTKSDIPDDDSDEEHSDYSSNSSESNYSASDDQMSLTASNNATVSDADAVHAPAQHIERGSIGYSGASASEVKQTVGSEEHVHEMQQIVDKQEPASHIKQNMGSQEYPYEIKQCVYNQDPVKISEASVPGPNRNDKPESFLQTELSTPPSISATTTLAVSSLSGTCSKPVSLSISTTNVRSEHVWIPPTLSPSSINDHGFNRMTHNSSGSSVKSPTDTLPNQDNAQSRGEGHRPAQNKDLNKYNAARKPEHSLHINDSEHLSVRSESFPSRVSPPIKDVYTVERHLTPAVPSKEMDAIKRERADPVRAQLHPSGPATGSDKNSREKEKEEMQRQKMKEERSRKEERNRKDREREERRERERREEKEVERMREEEKSRKVQAENKSNKESSTVIPSSDPSRRPPGGVAEAAAFSDYMRVLAAGHGHAFMPPTPNYMSSLFTITPQESPLPTHLLHPMSVFGPHLSSIHKDPLMYQTTAGVMPGYNGPSFPHFHPMLQRHQYSTQQSILDYQRSLAAASSYQWQAAYPYFLHDMAGSSSPATSAAANAAAGAKRSAIELEATAELNAKRMRMEGRPTEYTSPWDYFAAAAAATQHLRLPNMTPSLPCGLESTSVDKTAEFLRKRYMEYGPQAVAYLSAIPEYARPVYHCACADHRNEDIRMWNVEDVCKFLSTLEGCAIYADHFREQRVNGRILSLLTTDHLVKTMGMKLGPAVLLFEAVAKKVQEISKMSNCEACRSIALSHPVQPMVLPL